MSVKIKPHPSGIYRLEVQVPDGKGGLRRSRPSTGTRDRAEAERQRVEWIAGTHPLHPSQGGVIAPKGQRGKSVARTRPVGGVSVLDWLDRCLSEVWAPHLVKAVATHRSNVRILSKLIPETLLLADIRAQHVAEVERALRSKGYAEASIKKLLGTLSRALEHATTTADEATGEAYLTSKPRFPSITPRNVQDRILTRLEEDAVLDALDARVTAEPTRPWWLFKALVIVMLDAGFRLGEAMQLGQRSVREKRWMDPISGEIIEGTYLGLDRYVTKNDRPREVPATERVLALVPALNAQAVRGRWFPWPEGSGGPWYLWNTIRGDMLDRGFDLSDVRQHTFRHTCATRLAEGGMDLIGLRDWLGHSDIKITAERYIHLMSSHLYRGAAILNTFHGRSPMFDEATAQ